MRFLFRRLGLGVMLTLLPTIAGATTPPRSPAAQARVKELASLCVVHKVDTAYLHAALNTLGDDDFLQVTPAELLEDLQAAVETRTRFPWGAGISDTDFKRYVLPLRVDDEPLQRYRARFLKELTERVKNCRTIEEAALEVNLWLGERVTFRSTDWRDQGPLTTIACGFGRCGEETILAVDALRSVGIPARMVYVPFWAHQNDNHAWVEVKTGEKWKYLGACEPEAALNRAWFDEPVLRAPILLARLFDIDSTESGAVRGRGGWQLNSTSNYFDPSVLTVRFPKGWSKRDQLWLSVFNYGGIRPIARLDNKDGQCRIELGAGDYLLLGSYRGKLFANVVGTARGQEVEAMITPETGLPEDVTLVCPEFKRETGRETSAEWRCKLELQRSRIETVKQTKAELPEWITAAGVSTDEQFTKLLSHIRRAPGNGRTIYQAYESRSGGDRSLLIELLDLLSDKDLREIDSLTLNDFAKGASRALSRSANLPDSLRQYVVSPKIGWEPTRVWREPLVSAAPFPQGSLIERARAVNQAVAKRIGKVRGMRPVDPYTAWLAQKTNERGAAVLACGLLRNAGVPARVNEGENWVTFWDGKSWLPLYPADPARFGIPNPEDKTSAWFQTPANLNLAWSREYGALEFQNAYDVVRLNEGWPDDRAEAILDFSTTDSLASLKVVPGDYLLTWGLRNRRGDVRTGARVISLNSGERRTEWMPVGWPAELETTSVEKRIELNLLLSREPTPVSVAEAASGKPLLILITAPAHEPSRRLEDLTKSLERERMQIVRLSGPGGRSEHPNATEELLTALLIPADEAEFRTAAPYYYVVMPNGRVLLSNHGYRLNFVTEVRTALKVAGTK